MKTRIYFLIGTFLLFSICLLSQVPPTASALNYAGFMNSASYGNTGIFSKSIPLHSVSEGNLKHDIVLNYNYSGLQVSDVGSNVGLGWHLSAGGSITRIVNGLEDDIFAKGYFYEGHQITNPLDQNLNDMIQDGDFDGEPDSYFVSAGQLNFEFTFDAYGNPTTITKSNIKIETCTYNGNQLLGEDDGTFRQFKITDEYGTIYHFGSISCGDLNSDNIGTQEIEIDSEVSINNIEWYLTKIESYDLLKSIEFTYDTYSYEMPFDDLMYCSYQVEYPEGTIEEICRTPSYIEVSEAIISTISTVNTSIDFIHGLRNDLENNSSGGSAKYIEAIEITYSGVACHSYDLEFDYFKNGSTDARLCLASIQKLSCDGSISEPPTTFEYYNQDATDFPLYDSKSIDHWGYFNGANNTNASNMIQIGTQTELYQDFFVTFGDADRDVSTSNTIYGGLKKISLPAGGYMEFDFDQNQNGTFDISDILLDSYGPTNCDQTFTDDVTFTYQSLNTKSYHLYFEMSFKDPDLFPECNAEIAKIEFTLTNNTNGEIGFLDFEMDQDDITEVAYKGLTQTIPLDFFGVEISDGDQIELEYSMIDGFGEIHLYEKDLVGSEDVGGIRLSQELYHDGNNTTNDMTYVYGYNIVDNSTITSGVVFNNPSYVILGTLDDFFVPYSYNKLQDFKGSMIHYKRIEKTHGSSTQNIGKTATEYFLIDKLENNITPKIPEKNDLITGNVKSVAIEDENLGVISSEFYTRHTDIESFVSGDRVRVSWWAWSYGTHFNIPKSVFRYETKKTFTDGVEDEISFGYYSGSLSEISYLPNVISRFDSEGIKRITENHYTANYWLDFSGSETIEDDDVNCVKGELINRNILNRIFRTDTRVDVDINDGDFDGELLDVQQSVWKLYSENTGERVDCNYNSFPPNDSDNPNTQPRIWKVMRYERNVDSDNNLENYLNGTAFIENQYYKYNISNGLPSKTGVPTSNLNTYTEYIDYQVSEQRLSTSDTQQPEDFITSYEYENTNGPLISRITQPNGVSTFYEYDGLQRLVSEENECQNTKVEYAYEYNDNNFPFYHMLIESDYSNNIDQSPTSNVAQVATAVYYDGLGREIQVNKISQAPTEIGSSGLDDIILSKEYDEFGRLSREYLPKRETSNGSAQYYAIDQSWLHSTYNYEDSPLSRSLNIDPPGSLSGNTISYGSNTTADAVLHLNNGNSGSYPADELYKQVTTDGNGNKHIVFTDRIGQTVLDRSQSADNSQVNDTYYINDLKSRVIKVLPPGTGVNDSGLIFETEYYRDDLVKSKKVPDKGIVNYKYDDQKRLRLVQDAVTLGLDPNQCIAHNYDSFNRPVISSWYYNFGGFQNNSDNTILLNASSALSNMTYDDVSKQISGEDYQILGSTDFIKSTYTYDNCSKLDSRSSNHYLNLDLIVGSEPLKVDMLYDQIGQVYNTKHTFRKTSSDLYQLEQQMHFDHVGRLIKNEVKPNGGSAFVPTSEIYFNEREEVTLKRLGYSNSQWLQDIDYTYEDWGALKAINPDYPIGQEQLIDCNNRLPDSEISNDIFSMNISYGIPSLVVGTPQLNGNISDISWQIGNRTKQIYSYQYDYLDRLTTANHYEFVTEGNGFIPAPYSSTYSYDVRGNMLTLTRDGLTSVDDCIVAAQIDDLTYTYGSGTNCISSVADAITCPINYTTQNNTQAGGLYSVEQVLKSYDVINPQTILEFTADECIELGIGFETDINSPADFEAYIEECNGTSDNVLLKQYGFIEGTGSTNSYTYDNNGNTTYDPNKGLTMTYNHLDRPEVMLKNNGDKIELFYTANGTLLQKKITTNLPDGSQEIVEKDYVELFELLDNELEIVYHSEGRMRETDNGLIYDFTIGDHLGNSRVTFSDLDGDGVITFSDDGSENEIIQEDQFYPFGMKHSGTWLNDQDTEMQYQYNGIDFVEDFGLHLNLATFRTLDASIARWYEIDPKSIWDSSSSPYSSMFNNPISFADVDGDYPYNVNSNYSQMSPSWDDIIINGVSYTPGMNTDGLSANTIAGIRVLDYMVENNLGYIEGKNISKELVQGNVITDFLEGGKYEDVTVKVYSSKYEKANSQGNPAKLEGLSSYITWNPTEGRIVNAKKKSAALTGGAIQPDIELGRYSPSVILAHEFTHIWDWTTNSSAALSMKFLDKPGFDDTFLEYRAVQVQNQFAKSLGQYQTPYYYGNIPFTTTGIFSTVQKYD